MLSSIKRVLITLLILTLAVIAWVYFYSKGRTFYSDESLIGNTIGNIYNGGVFCEQDNMIYFSNDEDGGKLYRMEADGSNPKKLSDDKAVYINVDENYIYYARAIDTTQYSTDFYSVFDNTGIYRINYNGSKLKAITSDPGAFLLLQNNYLFFQRYKVSDGFKLIRYRIDGTMERLLTNSPSVPIFFKDNYIYYTGDTNGTNINGMELTSYTEHTYYNGNFIYPIFTGDEIYYIDGTKKNRLYRMNRDGSNPTLLVKNSCVAFNITNSGRYLYYQTKASGKSQLCRINLQTMEIETVKKGSYKQISITEKYVFFKELDNTTTYRMNADGKVNVETFYTSILPTPTPAD